MEKEMVGSVRNQDRRSRRGGWMAVGGKTVAMSRTGLRHPVVFCARVEDLTKVDLGCKIGFWV